MVKIASDNRWGWARVSAHISIGTMGRKMEREEERDGNEKRRRWTRDNTCVCVCVCVVLITRCCIVSCWQWFFWTDSIGWDRQSLPPPPSLSLSFCFRKWTQGCARHLLWHCVVGESMTRSEDGFASQCVPVCVSTSFQVLLTAHDGHITHTQVTWGVRLFNYVFL